MSAFSNRINIFLNHFVRYHIRRRYRMFGGDSFSLISNNCLGGLVYHDLGLRFDSPTINMCMPLPAFIPFVERLDEMLQSKLTEDTSTEKNYPVGRIHIPRRGGCLGATALIHFVHYRSFMAAKDAWEKRVARVDRSRIVILATENCPCQETDLLRFKALPFPKLLLSPFTRTADLLGSEAVAFPELPANAFRISEFSGWNGHRFYHRIDVAQTFFRLLSKT